jgi:iron complex transport system substrate-binding protein
LRRALTISVAVAVVAAWCGLGWALAGSRTEAVTVSNVPQRIVSLTPDVTEILFALGLGDRVVGVSTFSDFPPEAAAKPIIGTYWEPDVEAIIARKPDLVAGESSSKSDVLQRLSRMGYRTQSVKLETIADLMAAIASIGESTGQRRQAGELQSKIEAKLSAISALVAGKPRPKVLWIVQAEPLRIAGRGTFINEIVERAGGQNAIGITSMQYPPIGIEQVLTAGVDVIIQPAMLDSTSLEKQRSDVLRQWSEWTAIPAVRTGAIYVIAPDTVSRLSPRLPDGVEMVARLLHPDCFEVAK